MSITGKITAKNSETGCAMLHHKHHITLIIFVSVMMRHGDVATTDLVLFAAIALATTGEISLTDRMWAMAALIPAPRIHHWLHTETVAHPSTNRARRKSNFAD